MSLLENTITFIRDILRKNGITGEDSIKHCIVFILSRYLTNDKCEMCKISLIYSFENILNDENNQPIIDDNLLMEKFYNKKVSCFIGQIALKLHYKMDFKLNDKSALRKILEKIATLDVNHLNTNFDIVGTIYEMHLKTGSGQAMRDLGQFYSSRHIINYMVQLCDPKLINGRIETILDPTVGSGRFLSMSIKYLNSKCNNINWEINKNNIYGFDIDENVKNMTLLNLLLETGQLFENTIHRQDTLKYDITNPTNNETLSGVDIILANPPFGLKNLIHAECCNKVKNLKIRGTKGEPLFLQLMMESLNENGRCAVIVPEGILFNDSSIHNGTRQRLMTEYNLKKIIMMDDGFFMNTNVKCCILFFAKTEQKTTSVEYVNIKNENGNIIENHLINVGIQQIIKK